MQRSERGHAMMSQHLLGSSLSAHHSDNVYSLGLAIASVTTESANTSLTSLEGKPVASGWSSRRMGLNGLRLAVLTCTNSSCIWCSKPNASKTASSVSGGVDCMMSASLCTHLLVCHRRTTEPDTRASCGTLRYVMTGPHMRLTRL